jgi:hypothetical protein
MTSEFAETSKANDNHKESQSPDALSLLMQIPREQNLSQHKNSTVDLPSLTISGALNKPQESNLGDKQSQSQSPSNDSAVNGGLPKHVPSDLSGTKNAPESLPNALPSERLPVNESPKNSSQFPSNEIPRENKIESIGKGADSPAIPDELIKQLWRGALEAKSQKLANELVETKGSFFLPKEEQALEDVIRGKKPAEKFNEEELLMNRVRKHFAKCEEAGISPEKVVEQMNKELKAAGAKFTLKIESKPGQDYYSLGMYDEATQKRSAAILINRKK